MSSIQPQIETSWKEVLAEEFPKEYFARLKSFLVEEKKKYAIYPPGKLIFNAFNLTPFHACKVVILGQDPYHEAGQAEGLCFSVPQGVRIPPSLANIYKEIENDLGIRQADHGHLTSWAAQGVLLLNATLTVRQFQAGSHQNKGWETFSDCVIQKLSEYREHLVFILWGNYARSKKSLIDSSKHLILEGPHPSPLSAHRGFFGGKYFSKANAYLVQHQISPIDWKIQ